MEKCLCSLDTKLFLDDADTFVQFDHFNGSDITNSIALAECAEYHFLDSGIFILNYATNLVTVFSISALIAKQCTVHQTKC